MNHLKTVLSLFGFIPFVVQASVPCSDTQSAVVSQKLRIVEWTDTASRQSLRNAGFRNLAMQLREYHQNKFKLNGDTLVRTSKHPNGIKDTCNLMGRSVNE